MTSHALRLAGTTLVVAALVTPGPSAHAQPPEPTPPAPVEAEPVPLDEADDDDAQTSVAAQRGQRAPGSPRPVRIRLSGHAGVTSFTASDSFETILGSSSGAVYGGGAGVLIGRWIFVDVQVSRFSAEGERVFVTDSLEVFPLGIPTTVTTTPVDVSVGWRFAPGPPRPGAPAAGARRPGFRPVPFVGGGVGVLQYEEVADFAEAGDNVSESHSSYHVLGGVELPVTSRFGASVDVLHRWVPDALGEGGVSAAYGDTDLGGFTFRVRATVTF